MIGRRRTGRWGCVGGRRRCRGEVVFVVWCRFRDTLRVHKQSSGQMCVFRDGEKADFWNGVF